MKLLTMSITLALCVFLYRRYYLVMEYLEENDFISLEEYKRSEAKRATEANLKPNELYMAMFKLDSKYTPAAKVATRILGIVEGSGVFAVKFTFLDDRLQNTSSKTAHVKDGYMTEFVDGLDLFSSANVHQVTPYVAATEGYFKDYFADIFEPIFREPALAGIDN